MAPACFNPQKLTKIVLPKVLQIFILYLLDQRTEPKNVSFFQRNKQYRARLKDSPFQFFGIVGLFSKKFLTRGSPFNFGDVLRQKC